MNFKTVSISVSSTEVSNVGDLYNCTKNEVFRFPSVNVTKSPVFYEFGHIY